MLPSPFFLPSFALRKKIEREGLSSVPEINFPREASHSLFVFLFFLYYVHIYIFTYLLILGLGVGPVGQPPLALNEKALYLPKPHPSNKIM